jgi:hypothetical protein
VDVVTDRRRWGIDMRAGVDTLQARPRAVALITIVALIAALIAVGGAPPAAASSDPAALERACPDPIPPAGFEDVGRGGTHARAIDCLLLYGITQGVTASRYEPTSAVNREQMATFIARLMREAGAELATPSTRRFTDVSGTPHVGNIEALADAGVAQGTTSTTFEPRESVTRAQMATFIDRMLRELGLTLPDASVPFSDVPGGTHAPAIGRLAAAGVVQGTSADTYGPRDAVTRAQMASFLMRAADLLVAAGLLDPPDLGLVDECVYIAGDATTYECTTQNPTVRIVTTNLNDTTGCEFDITIDFGDGSSDEHRITGGPAGPAHETVHTYDSPGSYTIVHGGEAIGLRCFVQTMTYTLLLL